MDKPMLHINGLKVFETFMASKLTNTPVKQHDPSKGSAAYHRRIQKKWNKRYGFREEPCIVQTPDGLFVHPALMPELERQISSSQSPKR